MLLLLSLYSLTFNDATSELYSGGVGMYVVRTFLQRHRAS